MNEVRHHSLHRALRCSALIAMVWFVTNVSAQQKSAAPRGFPDKPVRLVVGNEPGGGSDITARLVAQKLSERWGGNPVVVENRTGAGGLIAMALTAKAPADGYSLMIVSSSQISTAAGSKLDFDVQKSFSPIAGIQTGPFVLVVSPSLPVASVKDLIALAKAKPGTMNYASSGNGSTAHLGTELLKSLTGTDMTHVPYKGIGPGITDLMRGQVQLLFSSTTGAMPQIKAGKIKALAVTSLQRSKLFPDWPTISESGVPGFEMTVWFGIIAPADTPRATVTGLNQDINQIVQLADMQERFTRDGAVAWPGPPEQFRDAISKEFATWSKLITDLNIQF